MDRPLKILVLASWFRPGGGGAFVHLSEIYRRLPFDIVVVGDRQPGDESTDSCLPWRVRRVPIGVRHSLGRLHTAVSLWESYREVRRIVASEKPDVLHAAYYLPWALYAAQLQRARDLPYALFTWGEDVLAAESSLVRRQALRYSVAHARWLFSNSEFTTDHLRRVTSPRQQIVTVFGGADLQRFRPDLPGEVVRRRFGLENRLVLLSVGALREQQGIDQLLGCVARLATRFPDLHYLIVGKGHYEAALRRRAADLGIGPRVTFAGYVPDEELPLYYAACDVFALLHRRVETTGEEMCFGLVFLEAGACGKPVVASRIGGTHYAVRDGETGWLVQPESDQEADERLACLLAEAGLRAYLGAQARSWIESTYSWDRAAQLVRDAHGS